MTTKISRPNLDFVPTLSSSIKAVLQFLNANSDAMPKVVKYSSTIYPTHHQTEKFEALDSLCRTVTMCAAIIVEMDEDAADLACMKINSDRRSTAIYRNGNVFKLTITECDVKVVFRCVKDLDAGPLYELSILIL